MNNTEHMNRVYYLECVSIRSDSCHVDFGGCRDICLCDTEEKCVGALIILRSGDSIIYYRVYITV